MSAQRVMFTTLAICCAVWRARGARSATRKICTHARLATTSSPAISSTLRQSSDCGQSLITRNASLLCLAVRDEDVAEPPHRLDKRGFRRVGLDEPPQARDLYVDAAIERAELAAARELHQLVARERRARM